MPKMNGLEALEIIKRLYPDMKIVVMTAYADMEKTHYFLEKGVIDFIAKPFSLHEIKNVLDHALQDDSENQLEQKKLLDKRLNFIGQSKEIRHVSIKPLKYPTAIYQF